MALPLLLSASVFAEVETEGVHDLIRLYIQRLGQDYSETYRAEAKTGLIRLSREALPFLIDTLPDPDLTRRANVVELLGELRDRRAVHYLLRTFDQNSSVLVRCKTLEALGKMSDASLFDWMVGKLKDKNVSVRSFAIWALGELKSEKAVPVLWEVVRREKGYPMVTAIDALGKCGTTKLSVPLAEFLKYENTHVRYVTAKTLARVGDGKIVPALFDAMWRETDPEVQEALAHALGKIGGKDVVERFVSLLTENSASRQRLAETGLEAAGVEAIYPLIDLLKSPDVAVKATVAKLLGALQASAAVPTLLDMLESSDKTVRTIAVMALGDCGGSDQIDPLMRMARSKDQWLRQSAMEAIEKIAKRQREQVSVNP